LRVAGRQRGVATTEAVVALPVLALLLFGLLHLHGVLRAKLLAERDARREAWMRRDEPACGSGQDVRDLGGGAVFPGEVTSFLPGGIDAIFGYGRASAQSAREVGLVPLRPGDGARRRQTGRVVVTCNEQGQDGLLDALGGILRKVSGR